MIYYKKRFGIKIADIFHDQTEKPDKKVDILSYYFVAEKQKRIFTEINVCTIMLDLSKTEEELFSGFSKTTKYQINRAKNKDGLRCVTLLEIGDNNKTVINDFLNFFNDFARSKRLPCLTMRNLEQYINSGTLCIRSVLKDNEVLTMHLYDVSDKIAWLQRSCSLFRVDNDPSHKSLIGRANRLLHWEDIKFFRQKGRREYNFGGYYTGGTDKDQLMVNEFKDHFNGELKELYLYTIPISFAGYLFIFLHFIRNSINTFRYKLSRSKLKNFREKD